MEKLLTANQGKVDLGTVTGLVDDGDVTTACINIGLKSYQQGLATSMSLECGGFDTHSDNDTEQPLRLASLYNYADYILTQANAMGLPVVLVMGSDFWRTPAYTGTGTDHWPVTSMIVITSNAVGGAYDIPGNRVIGASTDGVAALQAMKVNPNNPTQLDANGKYMTPADVIMYLRKKAQIDTSPAIANYPVASQVTIT